MAFALAVLLLPLASAITSSPTRVLSSLTSCWQATAWLDVTYQSGTACAVLEPANTIACQVFPSGILAVLNVSNRPPLVAVITDYNYSTSQRVCVSCDAQYTTDDDLRECKDSLKNFAAASFSIESMSHIANIQLVRTRTTMASYMNCFSDPASIIVESAERKICASVTDTATCSSIEAESEEVVLTVYGAGGESDQYVITSPATEAADQSSAPPGAKIVQYCYECPDDSAECVQRIQEILGYPWTHGVLQKTATVSDWPVQIDQELHSVQGLSYQECYMHVRIYVLHDSLMLQLVSAASQDDVCRISSSMAVDNFRYGLGVKSKDQSLNYFQYHMDERFDMGRNYTLRYTCGNELTADDGPMYSDVSLAENICDVFRDPTAHGLSSADDLLSWASVDFLDSNGKSLQVVRLKITASYVDCFERLTVLIYDGSACVEMFWSAEALQGRCYIDLTSRRTLSLHLMRPNPDKPFNPESLGRLQVRTMLDTNSSRVCFPCSSFSSTEYETCSAMLHAMWDTRKDTYVALQDSATVAGEYEPAIPVDQLKNRQYVVVYAIVGVLLALTAIGLSVDVGIRWSALSRERKVLAKITRRQRRENNRLQRRLESQAAGLEELDGDADAGDSGGVGGSGGARNAYSFRDPGDAAAPAAADSGGGHGV